MSHKIGYYFDGIKKVLGTAITFGITIGSFAISALILDQDPRLRMMRSAPLLSIIMLLSLSILMIMSYQLALAIHVKKSNEEAYGDSFYLVAAKILAGSGMTFIACQVLVYILSKGTI